MASLRARRAPRPQHGDVWWLEDEGIGRRPVVILTRDSAIPVLALLVVAPITRTIRAIPSEIELDESDGMPQPCAATLDNIRTISKSLLTQRITTLTALKRAQLCAAMDFAIDC